MMELRFASLFVCASWRAFVFLGICCTYPYASTVNFIIGIIYRNAFRDAVQEVFRQVFQDAFREIFRKVFRDAIQKVVQEAFRKIGWLKKTLAKVVDFEPLGPLSSPGAPDSDSGRFQSEVER